MRPTSIYSLSAELGANTIDPYELNCRVRNGNGCDLVGINISLIKASMCKRTKLEGTVATTIPFTLKSCSPFTRRVIAYFQLQITRKAQVFSLTILYWIKEYGQASRPISTD